MALAATAQPALPTWDDTIVPALRKSRLESESRILAKRISIASVSSVDDSQRSSAPSASPRPSRDAPQTPRHIPDPRKSSAIPRPSLQYTRTITEPPSSNTRVNGVPPAPSATPKRARTYSQPPSPNGYANNPLPTPDSSRPTSPRTSDVKPTRIPIVARTRTTSASSHAHSVAQRTESRTGSNHRPYQPPTPDTYQDHWSIKQSDPQHTTTPPTATIRHQGSSIINEPAPFTTSSIASSIRSRTQEPIPLDSRPSNESEERPFEHWYRGDVHRNGGVGELRVARQVEMLQIANYGHTIRNNVRGQTRNFSGPQLEYTRGRKRSESVGAGTRESICLDDERTKDVSMVLDETPLTDIETDPDTDPEAFYDAYASGDPGQDDPDDTIHANFNTSTVSPPPPPVSSSRSQTPTGAMLDGDTTPKYSARPQTPRDPLRPRTPSGPARASGESMVPSTGSRPRTTSPTSQLSDQSHTKRRAKSPVAPSTPKKVKVKAKTAPPSTRKVDPRSSVAVYPTPEGNAVDAIPSWTEPVQKSGTWDEVVLPVVARKKGLDGQYEQAFGSPKPRSSADAPVKPAPGTFGFDYTKYRPPRFGEEIPMHELGEPEEAPPPEEDVVTPHVEIPQPTSPPPPLFKSPEPRQDSLQIPRSESPAPFAQYHVKPSVPTINITRPSLDTVDRRQVQEDEDVRGGCCKCVIM